MKADLLSLLTAKSMNYEISSGNHDAITSEDIAHFLGTRGLDNREYDFLMAKYTDCLLYTSPSPRDVEESRMPSSA